MRLNRICFWSGCVLLVGLAACQQDSAPTDPTKTPSLVSVTESKTYILTAQSTQLREGLVADVQAAGGQVVSALDRIGVIIATSADPDFAQKAAGISGILSAVPDRMVQWVEPPRVSEESVDETTVGEQSHGPTGVGAHETFRLVQWAPDAVNAPAAWNAGYQGAGARVAILDGGINSNHIDIAANLDVARSKSFVVGVTNPFTDLGAFWHGTHVAGIVAAPANNVGVVGIAPQATLIGVKVLHGGSGTFAAVIGGILYAADPISAGGGGADIINMSLGAAFFLQDREAAELTSALSRATMYANQQGVTVIASAGNSAFDLDRTANLVTVPAQSAGVVAISALGPMGWAVPGTAFNLDRPASYTNFGQSAIHLAGPGGDFALPGNAVCSKPRVGGGANVVQFCWVFDMVFSAFGAANGSFGWAAGTSMASPAVAGVAAIIVGKARSEGISLTPAQVRTALERSADDLGKPGNDDVYGAGRVNALRAVQ